MKQEQPKTPQQWQEAVNLAELYSRVDAAVKYGFVEFTGTINLDRCHEMLERGRKRGVYPVQAQVDELLRQLVLTSKDVSSNNKTRKKTEQARA
jgi:hypothetical protein